MRSAGFTSVFLAALLTGFSVSADSPVRNETKTVPPAPASAQDSSQTVPGPAVPQPKSHYFTDSGSQADSLVDRIRFKINYSWYKSGEYFRLAIASLGDSAETKKRDVKARAAIKKDELIQEGKQAIQNTADQAVRDLGRKGEELKQDLGRMGEEIKTEASRELREKTDRLVP